MPLAVVAKKFIALATVAPASHSAVGAQPLDLRGAGQPPAPFRQIADRERADGAAEEIEDRQADAAADAADLMLLALHQDEAQRVLRHALDPHGPQHLAVEQHAPAQL